MSIRAHRVVEVKTSAVSFNLYHDTNVAGWLDRHTSFFNPLNCDCCGLTEVSVDDLKAMLSEIGGEMEEGLRNSIEADIKFAEDRGDEYVQYYCY